MEHALVLTVPDWPFFRAETQRDALRRLAGEHTGAPRSLMGHGPMWSLLLFAQ